ncbi:DivIVA domain-containing protein [Candidatus Blastococcus massiliensis]|uniref:DivIVA domain-containing protein n=1 Tax=Candidatus Blastococcus massiliensis TaxID=1470358 RepID=UPI0006845E5C|nr:DivIVA domain-containing protein [Candidatus Blastococcus massiliensis]
MAGLTGAAVRAARPGRPGWGKKGYEPTEVDAFLARAADALDALAGGRAPGMTADDVHRAVFRKPGLGKGRGYDEDEVDALLEQVERTLRDAPGSWRQGAAITADELRAVELGRPPMGRRGYAPGEVDAFLVRATEALTARSLGRTPELTAEEVRDVIFRKPAFAQRGYDEDQVDALLDRIQATLRAPTR